MRRLSSVLQCSGSLSKTCLNYHKKNVDTEAICGTIDLRKR